MSSNQRYANRLVFCSHILSTQKKITGSLTIIFDMEVTESIGPPLLLQAEAAIVRVGLVRH